MTYFAFLPQSFQVTQDSKILLEFETKQPDNSDVDVTTGYDARLTIYTLAQPDRAGHVYQSSPGDFTYLNGKVQLPLDVTTLNAIHTGLYGYQVNISDDSFGTDDNIIAAGQLQVVPSAFNI